MTDFIDIKGDISNEADTKNIAAKTMEKYGKIDVLINCAAIFGDQQLLPFMHIPVDFWRKVMDVNITGNFLALDRRHSGRSVFAPNSGLWLREGKPPAAVGVSRRVGITRAAERALRYFDPDSPAVSGPRRRPRSRQAR